MASTSEPAECRLLDLAPELRNRIYEYVLCDDDCIEITKDNWMQPALLQTCKTIRNEGMGIYYCENRFDIRAVNFDCSIMLHFLRHTRNFYDRMKVEIDVSRLNSEAWPNLLGWLKADFEGRLPIYPQYDAEEDAEQFNTAAKAFDIVHDLQAAGNTWITIEKVLESYKILTADVMEWDSD
ncbi:hypothetical protein HII31_07792 [Pseudocercospora fuligena]|uniref:Uncharacterized protein n=1 Tax=Pseudocercospora fuligena TaxID=685502 RepID=A0A8H6VFQ4_9PEZI|nr:hypothetical protein HII31_07792 [Pseudocercospora fuligena]